MSPENEDLAREYTVSGMTCNHCVASVREEVGELTGVRAVEVELETGALKVTGAGFSDEDVKAAVETAGYEVS